MTKSDLRDQKTHFAFGKNWIEYAENIDDARIAQATADLQRLSGRQDLAGCSFIDIGCGSGLHALAAMRLGASNIVGLDIDPESIDAARETMQRFAMDEPYRIEVCSVFDLTPDRFGKFDIVYSWGVLHHTGDMYEAVAKAADLVSPSGEFYVALYKKTMFCSMWRAIKRWYSGATEQNQARARNLYISTRRCIAKIAGRDFDAYIAEYGKRRGMDFYNDVHDWMGGYPYESISPKACHALLISLGFELKREFIGNSWPSFFGLFGSGCDEYVFRRAQPQ